MPEKQPHFPESLKDYDPEKRIVDRQALERRIAEAVNRRLAYSHLMGSIGDFSELWDKFYEDALIEAGLQDRRD